MPIPLGSCAPTVEEVIPESGSAIADVVGTRNISLFCDLRSDGRRVIVDWFQQTPEDREEGRNPESILQSDGRFTILGDNFTAHNFSLLTNLTILSLTEDLDGVIIFCGFGIPIVNFTLRIYRQWLM